MEKKSLGIIESSEQSVLSRIISNKEPEEINSILTKSFCCLHKLGMVNLNNTDAFETLTKDPYYASLLDDSRQIINQNNGLNINNNNDYS